MIRSAVLRLTLAYLAILMVLSIGFSLLLYRISVRELAEELRQPHEYELVQPGVFLDFSGFRDARLAQARRHLIVNLVVLNLGTLVVGSLLSYGLAKRSIRPIEEALETQSRFAADASHELRTPLTALQTELEVSLRDEKLSLAEAKTQLASNLEEVIKLRTLSDRLLKLARHDEAIDIKKITLRPVIQSALSHIQPLAKNKQIKIDNRGKNLRLLANAQHLEDCLVILLDNAIKYSPQKATITIKTGQQANMGFVSIADKGQGIKTEDLPHIFDRFYRADHSRNKDMANGYGLGLSIAQKITEAQDGIIQVKSNFGKGSVFTIKLPLPSRNK